VCRLWVAQLFARQINKYISTIYFRGTHVGKLTLCVTARAFDVWLNFSCSWNLKESTRQYKYMSQETAFRHESPLSFAHFTPSSLDVLNSHRTVAAFHTLM
jgi:hypothetical protein